jgi:isopenicillin-N epimerase
MRKLVRHVRARLTGLHGLMPATPEANEMSGPLMALQLPPGIHPEKLRRLLWERRIEMPVIERPDRLLLRTSTHFYNTEDEIDALADALPTILPNCRC